MAYISWSSDFALHLEGYLMGKCHNWNIGSMWCKDLPDKMYVGQWPSFHCPVILSYILKTTWWINVVLEILIQCDTNIELKLCNCRPVTYIHGPVILPYILKTIWWANVITGILDPCDAKINHIKRMCVAYISWSSDFDLYLEDVLMEECWTEDIDSVWN